MRENMHRIDWISLTTQCNDILIKVRERIADKQDLRNARIDEYNDEDNFVALALKIPDEASGYGEMQERTRVRDRHNITKGSPQLRIVAEVLKEHLTSSNLLLQPLSEFRILRD